MNENENMTTSHDAMGSIALAIKRLTDIICAATGLVILSPVFLLIALLLKMQGNGAVIFRQIRIGYKGQPFVIFKFRTMSSIIEENGPQLVAKCDDSNSTKLEQFLRGHHLDELPQLWNVLCGDMSLVGPRPERKFFIDQILAVAPSYLLIYQMRPGLTSEATLYNGYTDTVEKMVRRLQMDLDYLKRRTLWLDFTIVVKTVVKIISGKTF